MINDNTYRLNIPEGEVRELTSPNGLLWERAVNKLAARGESAYVTRNNGISSLKAYGGTPIKHKTEKLWNRYVPAVASDTTTYPIKDSSGAKFVKDIGFDGQGTDFGYYNEFTNEFVKAQGASGSLIQPIAYAESDGTAYCDTGIKITSNDDVYLDGCVTSSNSTFIMSQGLSANNQAYQLANTAQDKLVFDIQNYNPYRVNTGVSALNTIRKIHIKNKEIFVDGVSKGTSTGTLTNPTDTAKLMYSISGSSAQNVKIAKFAVVGKCDYIPVRIGTTVELLDLVNWTFATRVGTFTAGADIPYAQLCPDIIKVNTGDIKYGQYGKNLFDGISNLVFGKYIVAATGEIRNSASNYYCETYFEIKPNTSYVYWGERKSDSYISRYNRIHFYDATKTFISSSTYVQGQKSVAISPANAKYARLSCNVIDTGTLDQATVNLFNWYFGEGIATTEYEPYKFRIFTDGSHTLSLSTDGEIDITRDIPMLLSADSNLDVQSGVKTEAWGIKVLDGTETWDNQQGTIPFYSITKSSIGTNSTVLPSGSTSMLCTHYNVNRVATQGDITVGGTFINFGVTTIFDNIELWKAYLASEYAKGTPVIILYPLATPVTEQVTIAPVTSNRRTTYVADDESEIGKLNLELNYLGK